jgi:hypothetical protein
VFDTYDDRGALVAALPVEMQAALDRYDREATPILEALVRDVEGRPAPPMLYHYTNAGGLRGILESGVLWVSDLFSMNDPSELRHGLVPAISILKQRAAGGLPETSTFASVFERFDIDAGIEAAAHFFALSFSGERDDLSQWRAYGDDGRGFVLGFDTSALEAAFIKHGDALIPQNCTFSICYDDAELYRVQNLLADRMYDLISLPRFMRCSTASARTFMSELSVYHAVNVIRAGLFFKHEAYRSEREYRFAQIHRADLPAPDVKLRPGKRGPIRYRDFDWRQAESNALREVGIGPAAVRGDADRFALDCLTTARLPRVSIRHSKIPYRS